MKNSFQSQRGIILQGFLIRFAIVLAILVTAPVVFIHNYQDRKVSDLVDGLPSIIKNLQEQKRIHAATNHDSFAPTNPYELVVAVNKNEFRLGGVFFNAPVLEVRDSVVVHHLNYFGDAGLVHWDAVPVEKVGAASTTAKPYGRITVANVNNRACEQLFAWAIVQWGTLEKVVVGSKQYDVDINHMLTPAEIEPSGCEGNATSIALLFH